MQNPIMVDRLENLEEAIQKQVEWYEWQQRGVYQDTLYWLRKQDIYPHLNDGDEEFYVSFLRARKLLVQAYFPWFKSSDDLSEYIGERYFSIYIPRYLKWNSSFTKHCILVLLYVLSLSMVGGLFGIIFGSSFILGFSWTFIGLLFFKGVQEQRYYRMVDKNNHFVSPLVNFREIENAHDKIMTHLQKERRSLQSIIAIEEDSYREIFN